jgi:riboflavin synthase
MFTGIVEGKGRVLRHAKEAGGVRMVVDLGAVSEGVRVGDSIAVAGCCLTVESLEATHATFFMMGETLGLTRFADVKVGDELNLERSLRLGDRLGGHLVSGHVDGLGQVRSVVANASETRISIEAPRNVMRFTIQKGSITIDGVSLTIAALHEQAIEVALIPHTLAVTTLGTLRAGAVVHLEADQVGKWLARLTDARQ